MLAQKDRQKVCPGGAFRLTAAPLGPFQGVAADGLGILSREDGGAGGPAAGGVVELCEAQTAGGEFVEMGSGDLPAVTAKVGVAEVVGEEEEHVGRGDQRLRFVCRW